MSSWLKDCEACNVGLCETVDELKAHGLSEKKIFKQMSNESEGAYSESAIRHRYKYYKGGAKTAPQREKQPPIKCLVTDEEKELYQLCAKLKRIAKALQRANPNQDSWGLGRDFGIKLKSAKRNLYRTVDDYPGEGTEKQLLIWKTYFEVKELENVARVIANWLYEQLPEELPENRSKPKKKKPRYS